MARGLRGLNRARGPRRGRGWIDGPGDGTAVQNITVSGRTILGQGITLTADGITLVRLRGGLLVNLDTASAIGNGFVGAFGIGIVTETAFATGAAAVPTPITERDWDGWLFWHTIQVLSGDASDVGLSGSAQQRVEVDTKAMRKLNEESLIYGVIEVTEIGTAEIDVAFDSRMLILFD